MSTFMSTFKKWSRFPKRLQGGAILAPLFFSVKKCKRLAGPVFIKLGGMAQKHFVEESCNDLLLNIHWGLP